MVVTLVKKYRIEIIVSLLFLGLFLFIRLINLTIIPIFVDEAIYLRWAQIAKNDASWRFISLTDGKQPLFVWLTMVMMKFIQDPLVAGRVVSVLTGLVSMVGIWFLSFVLFENRRLAFFAAFLYLTSPFCLLYDRMALMDAMVGTFSIFSLVGLVLLVKTFKLDVALILGWILGGGILTKTSGFFNIYLVPLSLLLFDWRDKKRLFNLLRWLGLSFLAVLISQIFYSILRLSPWFHMIAQKDTTFVYPIREWLSHPFLFFWGNLKGQLDWLVNYLTLPIVILVILSLIFIWQKTQEKLLLFSWFFAPFVALALFGKVLYPRFILFMSLPLLVLAAWSLEEITKRIRRKWLLFTFYILLFTFSLYIDFRLLSNPKMALIPQNDRNQYIDSWPAGYGIKEIVAFANEKAKVDKIFIGTEGTFGLMPASLELYLWDNSNVEIKGFWPVKEIPLEAMEKSKEKPSYFVFNETQKVSQEWPLKLVAEYPRPDPHYSMRLYQILKNHSQ